MIAPEGMKAHNMIRIPQRTHLIRTSAGPLAIGTMLLVAGCSVEKVRGPRTENPERLTLGDFTGEQAQPVEQPTAPERVSSAPTSREKSAAPMPAPDLGEGMTLARTTPAARPAAARPVQIENPSSAANPQTQTASLELLDAKVGDVNGKPIFTSSFFAPIEDRLIAEAQRMSLNEWRANAGRLMAQRLDGIIADELLRAEALAALTPTQRVGLQAFLNNFRNNILSENLGSTQLATRRIQEQDGITLDEALRQKEVDTLVQLTLIREINRRVNVSWRDIKQRYERDIDDFAPPPSVVLRVIRAFSDEEETVSQITDRLARGDDFAEIAASELNNFNTDTQGILKKQIEGSFEETAFFAPDALNDATHTLSQGEYTGPVELGSSLYWIKYEATQQESISLYDAQLVIQNELTQERREEAKNQYFSRLQERARVSTRDLVLMRLFEIAEQRYAPRN